MNETYIPLEQAERVVPLATPQRRRPPPPMFEFLKIGDRDPLNAPLWIVPGAIAERSITFLTGRWGSRKSFVALDWCCRIAAGMPVAGKRVIQGPTIYLAGEGRDGLAARVAAWSAFHDVDGQDLKFRYCERVPDLRNVDQVAALVAAVDVAAKDIGPPSLVVFDTLSKALGGGSDTESKDVGPVLRHLEHLRDRFSCALLVLHHPSKADGSQARGLGMLEADTDGSLVNEWDASTLVGTVTPSKLKDGPTDGSIRYRCEVVEIGRHNITGEAVTSLAVEYIEGGAAIATARPKTWPRSLRLFSEALHEALAVHGADRSLLNGPTVRAVSVDILRPFFFDRYATGTDDPTKAAEARRKALQRVVQSAVAQGIVISETDQKGEWLWLP